MTEAELEDLKKKALENFLASREPAFPKIADHVSGLSVRDWFAGQVMAQMIGDANITKNNLDVAADNCFMFADAMIEARKR